MADVTILLPVTRPWAVQPFVAALDATSVPRGRAIVYVDAPGCDAWGPALSALGFDVDVVTAFLPTTPPPEDNRIRRRARHLQMRQITQQIVPDGLLWCLEDDTLVPPDAWDRLIALGPTASGVQRSRYDRSVGVWRDGELCAPRTYGSGVTEADACGLYCLLTTGEEYRRPFTVRGFGGAVDAAQTAAMHPRVDWELVCGHMTTEGVLMPMRSSGEHGRYRHLEEVPADVPTPDPPQHLNTTTGRMEPIMATTKLFRTHRRVVRDGFVQAGPKQMIPIDRAIAWGLCDADGNALDTADYEGRLNVPYVPVGLVAPAPLAPPETKIDAPKFTKRVIAQMNKAALVDACAQVGVTVDPDATNATLRDVLARAL